MPLPSYSSSHATGPGEGGDGIGGRGADEQIVAMNGESEAPFSWLGTGGIRAGQVSAASR